LTRFGGAKGLINVGDVVLIENASEIKLQPAVMVKVVSEAANVEVEITDRDRRRVAFEQLASENGTSVYLVSEPGKFWLDVTAIDFAKNIYRRSTGTVIEVPPARPIGPVVPPMPDLPAPSDSLKALVTPIGAKLAGDPAKAMAVSHMALGFADAAKSVSLPDVASLARVHVAAVTSLTLPPGAAIGSVMEQAMASHLGISRNDQGQWLDRPLTAADRDKIAEVYSAIGWAARQVK
jgi:hypothetical protein